MKKQIVKLRIEWDNGDFLETDDKELLMTVLRMIKKDEKEQSL